MLKAIKKLLTDEHFHEKKEFLKGLEIFKDLRDRELGHLAQALHERVYKEGEIIFQEGDIGRALFILDDGRVELTKLDAQGTTRRLFILEPGDFFGEMALLEQLPRSASAVAVEKSHLYLLYRSKLEELLQYYPRIGVSVMMHLAQLMSVRLRRASKQLMDMHPPTYG